MKTLVINAGSSSLKFQLIDKNYKSLAQGNFDDIGNKNCTFLFNSEKTCIDQKIEIKTLYEAIEIGLFTLQECQIIKSKKEITAIGHRVVHGGEKYKQPTIIDKNVIKKIKELTLLAPLHNPANLEAILICQKILRDTKQVAVFDTTFHQTMPEKAYLYGIPYDLYKNHKIRKYGFHGTNHKYVVDETIKLLKNKKAKIISCHLGNGSSITASKSGKSIDTSMGFTPLEGIIMGTRSGSIDPSIIFHLNKNLKLSNKKIYEILNHESGLKGLSQISHDMRDIYHASLKNNKQAKLSIEILSYQIAKHIGSYTAALNGVDAIVFTGGLGEKAFYVRQKVCNYLEFLGLKLDKTKNKKSEILISQKESKIKVFIIKSNEEKSIAKETRKLLKS